MLEVTDPAHGRQRGSPSQKVRVRQDIYPVCPQQTLQKRIAGERLLPKLPHRPAGPWLVQQRAANDLHGRQAGQDCVVGLLSDQKHRLDTAVVLSADGIEQVAVVVDAAQP